MGDVDEVWEPFLRVHAQMVRTLERELVESVDISLSFYDVLVQLRRAGDNLELTELSKRLLISNSGVTRLIDRMEKRGLVSRERSEQDRRKVHAVLTAEGKRLALRAGKVHLRGIKKTLPGTPDRGAEDCSNSDLWPTRTPERATMTDTGDCEYMEVEETARPPEGVLGTSLTGETQLEIRFDPKQLTDEEVATYAQQLAPPRFDKCLFRLQGRACEACALKLEKRTKTLAGVRKASATFVGQTMSISFDGGVTTEERLLQQTQAQGTPVETWTPEAPTADRVELAFTLITLLGILVAWWIPTLSTPAMVIAFFTGGFFGLQAAWQSLREATVDVDLLMILAALGAAYIGAPMEGAILLFLFSLSNVLQSLPCFH